jgi:TPR repeat protein
MLRAWSQIDECRTSKRACDDAEDWLSILLGIDFTNEKLLKAADEFLPRYCELGGKNACSRAGDHFLFRSDGGNSDVGKAAKYYALACQKEERGGCQNKGVLGDSQRMESVVGTARQLYRSCVDGASEDCLLLARKLTTESDWIFSSDMAHRVLELACINGDYNGCVTAGDILYQIGRWNPYHWYEDIQEGYLSSIAPEAVFSCNVVEEEVRYEFDDPPDVPFADRKGLCFYALACLNDSDLGCLKAIGSNVASHLDVEQYSRKLCASEVPLGCIVAAKSVAPGDERDHFLQLACGLGVTNLCAP